MGSTVERQENLAGFPQIWVGPAISTLTSRLVEEWVSMLNQWKLRLLCVHGLLF